MVKSIDTKDYREYLDKEMSIMGILSAFSVLTAGGVLSAIMASDKSPAEALWRSESPLVTAGAVFCVLAASFFYKQRSDLAWHYGRLCLKEADNGLVDLTIPELLKEADSWATWWPYSVAFTSLISGFIGFGLGLIFFIASDHWFWLKSHQSAINGGLLAIGLCASCNIARYQYFVLNRYKYEDDYCKAYRKDRLNFWRRP